MAEIYLKVEGSSQKVVQAVALHADVQNDLDGRVERMRASASSDLGAHRNDGHSFIEVEVGDVDRYLVLNDERGFGAALSIEFGRDALAPGQNAMFPQGAPEAEGLFVLHKAAGLGRRSRKK